MILVMDDEALTFYFKKGSSNGFSNGDTVMKITVQIIHSFGFSLAYSATFNQQLPKIKWQMEQCPFPIGYVFII